MTTHSSYYTADSDIHGKPAPHGGDDGEGEAT
jgi:hypothetical protein